MSHGLSTPVVNQGLGGLSAWLVTGSLTPSGTQDVNLIQVGGAAVALGQALSAASIPVVIASNQSAVPVSGTLTVNQGTDPWNVDIVANTIGLATAANQATQITAEQAIQAAVEIMKDWDESDRAKVNPIVGQTGVEAGAGNVSAATQRTVEATNSQLNTTLGDTGDAAATAGGVGSLSAKLRTLTGVVKSEDAGHTSTDTGFFVLGVRNTGNAVLAGTTLDYSAIGTDDRGNVGITTRIVNVGVVDGYLTNSYNIPADNAGSGVITPVYPMMYPGTGTTTVMLRGNSTGMYVQGNVASDVPVTANPLLAGGRASTAAPSAVSGDGDAVALWLSRLGAMMTQRIPSTTGTNSSVAATTSDSTTILSSNTARRGATVYNDSALASMRLSLGATCTATSYTVLLAPGGFYEVPYDYTGIITGDWTAASGNARITELT